MQTIGRVVKFDVQPMHKGPQTLYRIFSKYYGKEFESLKGTTAFIHADRHINAKEETVQFRLAGFIEFPEMSYAHPEMFVIARKHFPDCVSVGFMTERPHDAEPEKILREDDFTQFQKTWKEWRTSKEAKDHGIDATGYGPATPIFDFIVVQTPFSAPTSTHKKPGIMSFGQEKFIPFSVLSGDEEIDCDCPKCQPDGIKAQLLRLLESIHQKRKDPDADVMPDGTKTKDFIEKAKKGEKETCHKTRAEYDREHGLDDETDDEIDEEMRKRTKGRIIPFDPDKGKGRVH